MLPVNNNFNCRLLFDKLVFVALSCISCSSIGAGAGSQKPLKLKKKYKKFQISQEILLNRLYPVYNWRHEYIGSPQNGRSEHIGISSWRTGVSGATKLSIVFSTFRSNSRNQYPESLYWTRPFKSYTLRTVCCASRYQNLYFLDQNWLLDLDRSEMIITVIKCRWGVGFVGSSL